MKGPGRRKKNVKVRKKGLRQPSSAEEPDRPEVADSRAGAAGGLLPPNRVGQEEPATTETATPHPGEKGLQGAAGTRTPRDSLQSGLGTQQHGSMPDHWSLPFLLALLADQLSGVMRV